MQFGKMIITLMLMILLPGGKLIALDGTADIRESARLRAMTAKILGLGILDNAEVTGRVASHKNNRELFEIKLTTAPFETREGMCKRYIINFNTFSENMKPDYSHSFIFYHYSLKKEKKDCTSNTHWVSYGIYPVSGGSAKESLVGIRKWFDSLQLKTFCEKHIRDDEVDCIDIVNILKKMSFTNLSSVKFDWERAARNNEVTYVVSFDLSNVESLKMPFSNFVITVRLDEGKTTILKAEVHTMHI